MRFKVTLDVDHHAFGDLLPINYQYEQSAVIYRILSSANEQYATWLHDNGFQLDSGKPFKLFTFSRLKINKRDILPQEERIRILSHTVEWQLSFLPERSTENFIQGLFANQVFEIGDRKSAVRFIVKNIEVLPAPVYTDSMTFSTMSPICISLRRENGKIDYIAPDSPEAVAAVRQNLLNKYEVFTGNKFPSDFDFSINVLSKPKSTLITIKSGTPAQTHVRGYMCRFCVTAPSELMRLLYEAGVGEKGSLGFGMVQEIKKDE